MWSCFHGVFHSQKKKLKTSIASLSRDESEATSSSSAAKIPSKSKNKDVFRATNTTSVQSLMELLTFRYLASPSKSNQHNSPAVHPLDATPSSSSSSSVILITNNEDLLTNILLFLPPKSVIRFQSVSKQWFSLISSPRFLRLHSRRMNPAASTPAETGLFLCRRIYGNWNLNSISLREEDSNSMGSITSRLINFLNIEGEIMGLHSCNGLIWVDFYWNYEIRRYYVYNPTINQYKFIPQPKIKGKSQIVKAVNIVYDPFISDQYKLVCVVFKSPEEYVFYVYLSETGFWKDVDLLTDEIYQDYYYERGVVCNGNLYWTNPSRNLLSFDFELDCIKSMNMITASEESSESPDGILFYFGNSGGKLHLIDLEFPEAGFLNVFELDTGWAENHQGWLLKYRVDLGFLTARYTSMVEPKFAEFEKRFAFGILCFLVDEKEHKAKLMISLSGKIIFYEINDTKFQELIDVEPAGLQFLGCNLSRYNWKDAYKHFETLACV